MDMEAQKVVSEFRLTHSDTLDLARKILLALSESTVAKEIVQNLDKGEYDCIVSRSYDPKIHTPDDFLAINLLKKYPFKHPNLKPRATAVAAFLESERKCATMNWLLGLTYIGTGRAALEYYAQQEIAHVLGGDLTEAELRGEHTLGKHAAVDARGENAHALYHMQTLSHYDPSGSLRCYLYDIASMRGIGLTATNSSAISFVPKTGKTDRTICIEPSLNLMYQLAVGKILRRRLKRVGVDLSSQRHNQNLAVLGAIRGSRDGYATIDLSAASDSIARVLVEKLFARHPNWLRAIMLCRCPVTKMPNGETVALEKISSMGNGYTFPLETLIFYALTMANAAAQGKRGGLNQWNTAFYGDDIVVPSSLYASTCTTLQLFGFTINQEKSYATGDYRESCGVHALGRTKMRPLYLRGPISSAAEMYRVHNTLLAIAVEEGKGQHASGRWRGLIRSLVRSLPKSVREITCPPLRYPGELYQLSIQSSALYDLRFIEGPFKYGHDENGQAWLEGWYVNGVTFVGRRVIGWKGQRSELEYTLNPRNALAVMRLLLYQIEAKTTHIESEQDGRQWVVRYVKTLDSSPHSTDIYRASHMDGLTDPEGGGALTDFSVRVAVPRLKVVRTFCAAVFAVKRLSWE